MQMRKGAGTALAVMGLAALVASPASAQGAKKLEPLNQYVVTGWVNTDELARAGFDLTEGGLKGRKAGWVITATVTQADQLQAKGATVRPLGRKRTAEVAAPNPLTNPTHGYNVFRPWSLTPAPCPQTCATPNVPLKDWYADLARRNTDVVKVYVIGKSVLGQDIVAYKVTKNARSEQDGSRPAIVYNSTQHAREWIAAEVERRLFEYVVTNKAQTTGNKVADLLAKNELWFVPIVNPDGYDYTFVSPATRFWRKNLRDNNNDGAITDVDGVDPNRNWPTKWNYDLEGASGDPSGETFHGSGPASEPEVRALRGLIKRIRPSFQIDYHSFAQLILYPEGWQVETPSTDAPRMASLCPQNQAVGQGALANDPPGQAANCVAVSNDFQQYWLGAYLPIVLDPASQLVEAPLLGSKEFALNGTDSAANQGDLYSLLTTSSILKPDTYPQFKSEQAIKVNGPPAFDPPSGTQYVYSQQADSAYKRLTRTVDLTAQTASVAPALQFKVSYDTEAGFDYVFVEAHTVGQEDWTTLPDANGHTDQDTGLGCADDNPFWLLENPFLTHYITRSGSTGAFECAPTGTSGAWNAATGNSAGFQDWKIDLSAYAGKQVEVSISYASDPATQGLGGFVDGPGVATDHSLYWGFGLEGVTDRATRSQLIKDAMARFGVS